MDSPDRIWTSETYTVGLWLKVIFTWPTRDVVTPLAISHPFIIRLVGPPTHHCFSFATACVGLSLSLLFPVPSSTPPLSLPIYRAPLLPFSVAPFLTYASHSLSIPIYPHLTLSLRLRSLTCAPLLILHPLLSTIS